LQGANLPRLPGSIWAGAMLVLLGLAAVLAAARGTPPRRAAGV
jgi:hypothetical protein